jgi:DNA polymerase elongation subunit (family B)
MGIVMKRRDNAPIVKYVYGGAIEFILAKRDIVGAFNFVRQAAKDLLAGKFPMKRLTITKGLRAEYKASPPAHKVLANRIGKRDPGNKPSSNDRIPYVYIMPPKNRKVDDVPQGERVETPTYIREHSLKIDYTFYITNQIAKPISQVFGLVLDQLPGYKAHMMTHSKKKHKPVEAREAIAEELLFGDLLRDARREAAGIRDLRSFFTGSDK